MNAMKPVSAQPRPAGTVVMYQRWRRLLFLHWKMDPEIVQRSLPTGLTVDSWEGEAWLGVVPFSMEGVRPRFLPAVAGVSNFPELNVRTYVRDSRGRPGVWFYSLDCSQPLAVWAARTFFGLPYFHAQMTERISGDAICYACRRRGDQDSAEYVYRGEGEAARSDEGTIEQFLIERYRLFAVRGGELFSGEVWHEPYEIQRAEVSRGDASPLRQAGFDMGSRAPEHAVFAPGVDVRVFGLARV